MSRGGDEKGNKEGSERMRVWRVKGEMEGE